MLTMTYCETLYCFQECYSQKTKNNSYKHGKRTIWANFGPFLGPLFSPKQFLKKRSFKGTLMAISMLFRGNLWKMSQQFGVNLEKQAILG